MHKHAPVHQIHLSILHGAHVLHINLSAKQLQTQLFGAYLPPGEMLKDMIRLVAAEAHRTTTFTGGGWWKGVHFEWVFPLDVDAEAM